MKCSSIQVSTFCTNMSMLLASGIGSEEALQTMVDQHHEDDQFHKALVQMAKAVEEGESLNDAISQSNIFPDYVNDTLELGKYSGRYEQCFGELAMYYKRQDEIEQAISATFTRPVIFFIILAALLVLMELFVLPIFQRVYQRFGGTSNSMVTMAYVISTILLIAIIAVLVIAAVSQVCKNQKWCQELKRKFIEKSALTKNASLTLARYQLMKLLSILIASGSSASEAIEIVVKYINHTELKNKVQNCIEQLHEGDMLVTTFQKENVLDDIYTNIFYIGAKHGQSDEAVETIANHLEDDVAVALNEAIDHLEPLITIVFVVSIGLSLLSIILPLISVIAAIG